MGGATRDFAASFDLNQAPTALALSGTSVSQQQPERHRGGLLHFTTDPNPNDTFTYSLTSSAGGLFGIAGNQLVVANTAVFTNPPPASYSITGVTTDAGGQNFSQTFTITVTVVKTAPTITWAAPVNIALWHRALERDAARARHRQRARHLQATRLLPAAVLGCQAARPSASPSLRPTPPTTASPTPPPPSPSRPPR